MDVRLELRKLARILRRDVLVIQPVRWRAQTHRSLGVQQRRLDLRVGIWRDQRSPSGASQRTRRRDGARLQQRQRILVDLAASKLAQDVDERRVLLTEDFGELDGEEVQFLPRRELEDVCDIAWRGQGANMIDAGRTARIVRRRSCRR